MLISNTGLLVSKKSILWGVVEFSAKFAYSFFICVHCIVDIAKSVLLFCTLGFPYHLDHGCNFSDQDIPKAEGEK